MRRLDSGTAHRRQYGARDLPFTDLSATETPMRDVRFVIIHSPGTKWKIGAPIFEQEGVQAHIEHYRNLLEQGKLALGGPFLDAQAGGMMIPEASLGEDEIIAFANADPTVASDLLRVEVRPWLVGM